MSVLLCFIGYEELTPQSTDFAKSGYVSQSQNKVSAMSGKHSFKYDASDTWVPQRRNHLYNKLIICSEILLIWVLKRLNSLYQYNVHV